jgi:hypothetical protein
LRPVIGIAEKLGWACAEAEAMAAAAKEAAARGVRSMVAFNYRRVPAVAPARRFSAPTSSTWPSSSPVSG